LIHQVRIFLFSILIRQDLLHYALLTFYLERDGLSSLNKFTVNDFTQPRIECKSICMFYTAQRAAYGNVAADV